jgi:hypothetical protein
MLIPNDIIFQEEENYKLEYSWLRIHLEYLKEVGV